jgi:NAD(P)-dependent dehydrogenase (short-subunit alcohol dehydrogenase family)
VKECVNIFGGEVDVVIFNGAKQHFRPFDTYTTEEYIKEAQSFMTTNFFSFVVYYREFLPYLKKSKGYITVVSSGAAKMGSQFSCLILILIMI